MAASGGHAAAQVPPGAAQQRPEVGVVALHPQSVAITAELPGRTAASLVAEVRPQVNGIIRARLFNEGGEVKTGDPLYQIDPATYQAAYDSTRAALAKAEAAVPSAETKVERYQTLIKQNAVAKQDVDDALATLAQAKAAVAVAKADVETAKINLDYTTIRAPIGGRIDKSSLTPGALVTASQSTLLTTIRTIEPINVDITQSSRRLLDFRAAVDAGRIKLSGDRIKVRLKLENGEIYKYTGTLAFAEANVSQTTGTFTLRAQFPNPDRLLLPGMYVRAFVEEGVAENSFLMPQRAVGHNTKGEATALFVGKDNKVEERVLQLGDAVGTNWLVQGMADGDRVIVDGTQRARPGAQVQPVEVILDETTGEVRERKQTTSQTDPASSGPARTPAPSAN
ncbi:MAG: efflux RND transporter periplasmic adaptor subunit [Ancalomicrobiaceae bacterium]|nr:efflux RND transporter periplasmic adaptor subunit [Ancalomicrobiaceae bacterium]